MGSTAERREEEEERSDRRKRRRPLRLHMPVSVCVCVSHIITSPTEVQQMLLRDQGRGLGPSSDQCVRRWAGLTGAALCEIRQKLKTVESASLRLIPQR